MIWLFEHYSRTEDKAKNPELQPFKVKLSVNKIQEMLDDYFRKENYDVIKNKAEFNEFYASQKNYEVTIHMVPDGQIVRIVVAAYVENRIGKSRKRVMIVNQDLKEIFEKYLSE